MPTGSALHADGIADPPPEGPAALAGFHHDLAALESGARSEHVRILFMGDSHTKGAVFPGAFAEELHRRYGFGGPGFLHVGHPKSWHPFANTEREGVWATIPRQPSTTLATGDGIFGLGGLLTRSKQSPRRAVLSLRSSQLAQMGQAQMGWQLCVRRGESTDRFTVSPSGSPAQEIELTAADDAPERARVVDLSTQPPHRVEIAIDAGDPRFCGIVAERAAGSGNGVVVDVIGIDGAAYATPLAWNEERFREDVRRREPSLFILEYGTNEATDRTTAPEVFAGHLKTLVERLRSAAPSASCVVMSPTDRSDRPRRVPELHRSYHEAAIAADCAFFDAYAWMGGAGAMEAWADRDPPWAQADGIHLTEPGYARLGAALAAFVLPGPASGHQPPPSNR